jgi:Methyltransferase domain
VLDLGCGPGLTLAAFLDQGATNVVGIDRWPAFTDGSSPFWRVVAHDLTLPMSFLASGSFDAVFSHYALDYVSPIGMRQVLREAFRVLAPGGQLLIYIAAVGMGSADETRTAPYSPAALRTLLIEAEFDEIEVEATPNGRNSIARARRGGDKAAGMELKAPALLDGDTQLSAAFENAGDRVEFELGGAGHGITLTLDLPPDQSSIDSSRVSVCARVFSASPYSTELQLWIWRDTTAIVSECFDFEFRATRLQVSCGGELEHLSVWAPRELSVEPLGNGYVQPVGLPPGRALSEAERGAEGRQLVVEPREGSKVNVSELHGNGRNRLLLRRASKLSVAGIDDEWLAGYAHGVVFGDGELSAHTATELLLWAGWRQALVYIEGRSWERILDAMAELAASLTAPVVLVDPELSYGTASRPLPAAVLDLSKAKSSLFVLIGNCCRDETDEEYLLRLRGKTLHGGHLSHDQSRMQEMQEINETLRYLTERTVLMRLRQRHRRSWIEVGRRPRSI